MAPADVVTMGRERRVSERAFSGMPSITRLLASLSVLIDPARRSAF